MQIRFLVPVLLVSAAFAQAPSQAPAPGPKPVGTMSQLMIEVIFPTSNAVFYVRDGPSNEKEWIDLQMYTLMLGESANLLMAPERARDKDRWMKDAQLLLDVGTKAYKAAKARNVPALQELNAELYESCQSCHEHYRPG